MSNSNNNQANQGDPTYGSGGYDGYDQGQQYSELEDQWQEHPNPNALPHEGQLGSMNMPFSSPYAPMNNGHFLPTQKNEMPSSEPVVETEEMKSKPYFPPYPAFARGSTIGDPVSVEEKGRTWQNYKPGKYFLPNDAVEQDRLDFTHAGFRLLLGGDLYRSPLQGEPGRVLDIGTGTGIWAIDFAKEHPASLVIGSDLSLIQPDVESQVSNVRFVREDIEDQWVHDAPFDFIHLRLMFTCFVSHRDVIKKAFDNLTPGGWLEYQDFIFLIDSDDNSHRGTALHTWGYLACAGGAAKGRDLEAPRKYKDYMQEIGFVDVVEKKFKLPGNEWPKNEPHKTIGRFSKIGSGEVVKSISEKLLGDGLGIPEDKLNGLTAQAVKDVYDENIHFYWPGFIVYGRKPFDHERMPPPVAGLSRRSSGRSTPVKPDKHA